MKTKPKTKTAFARKVTTPKEPEMRSLQTINQEYFQLCARLGELEYRNKVNETDMESIRRAINVLGTEASTVQAKEALKKAAAAQETMPASPTENGEARDAQALS